APARPRAPAAPTPVSADGQVADLHAVVGGGKTVGEDGDGGGLGERLDELAARLYGDPSRWRALARANDLDDPLHLRGGTVLQLPAREGP
ncbi:MAG TPA: hypothetical protein VFB81_09545, partial [Myxococcales bacterium]|nr:hypothetical protein [Myxococcales bacterium]